MPRFKIRSGEKVVAADKCLHHKGPLAFKGEMTLTNERLVWMPSGRLDKMAGAKAIGFSLERIDKVEVSGLEKMLQLTVGGSLFKFSGAGALRLRERIALHSSSANDEELSIQMRDALNEKVLFQNEVLIYLKGNLTGKAKVDLTDLNLTIETKRGLETMLFSSKTVKTPVSEIEETVYSNLENKLRLTIQGETIILGGVHTSQLYVLLQSLEDRGQDSIDGVQCDATHYRGPLAIKGNLLVTTGRLLFCPTSQLDSLVGASALTIKLSDITQVGLEGWPEQRLVFTDRKGGTTSFEVPESDKQLRELRNLMLRAAPPPPISDMRSGTVNQAAAKAALEELGISLAESHFYLLQWGVLSADQKGFRVGWFILSGDALLLAQPKRGTFWEVPVTSVRQADQRTEPQVLAFDVEGKTYRLATEPGAGFVDAFWEALGQVRPETRYAYAKPNQPLRSVLGHHKTLNLPAEGREHRLPDGRARVS